MNRAVLAPCSRRAVRARLNSSLPNYLLNLASPLTPSGHPPATSLFAPQVPVRVLIPSGPEYRNSPAGRHQLKSGGEILSTNVVPANLKTLPDTFPSIL